MMKCDLKIDIYMFVIRKSSPLSKSEHNEYVKAVIICIF